MARNGDNVGAVAFGVRSAREVVRHIFYKLGLAGARGGKLHLAADDLQTRFSVIYETGLWRHGDDAVPSSGAGSSLERTASLRPALQAFLTELKPKTFLDIGCGDFTWMQHVAMQADYVGVDVVNSVIERNVRTFGRPGRRFLSLDATAEELPDADVVFCRDVLCHLCFEDIGRLLRNLLSKPRSYIILTNDRGTEFNANIQTGDFRLLNLEAGPFYFLPPWRAIDRSVAVTGRVVCVWQASQLANLLKGNV